MKKKFFKWAIIFLLVLVLLTGGYLFFINRLSWINYEKAQKTTSSNESENQSPEENKITVYCNGGKGEINITVISQKKQDLILNFFEKNQEIQPSDIDITSSEDGACFFVKILNCQPGKHTIVLKINNKEWSLQTEVGEVEKIILKVIETPEPDTDPTPEPITDHLEQNYDWNMSSAPVPTESYYTIDIGLQIEKEPKPTLSPGKHFLREAIFAGNIENNQYTKIIFTNIPKKYTLLVYCGKYCGKNEKGIFLEKEEDSCCFRNEKSWICYIVVLANCNYFSEKINWDEHFKNGENPYNQIVP